MLAEILIFLLTTLTIYFVYLYKRIIWKFDKYEVRYLPGYPLFGNILKTIFKRKHMVEDLDAVYKAYPNERYVGYLEGTVPIILIRDPELIKEITIKDFDHFMDHKQFFPENVEPLVGVSVLMMKGERWRDMRTTLSPAFTGSKMRLMLPFMTDTCDNIIEYLKENVDKEEDIDVSDVVRRYTNDVVASAAFGLQVDSLKDRDNEFYKLGQKFFNFDFWQTMAFFIVGMYPELSAKLNLRIFPEKNTRFFHEILLNTIAYREKNKVERPDMVQLLIDASKGNLKHSNTEEKDSVGFATVDEVLKPKGNVRNWTENELIGQALIFFVAGFESSATTVVMTIHELVVNPDVQQKLYEEIQEFKKTKGDLTYDNINDLKYLDCVLNETMRKWAAALIIDRVCTKPYNLPPAHEGGKLYPVKVGDIVYNLVNPIHMDPKYFPNPEKFDPERFSDENKHNIKPFTFMPFGLGPRNCIGSRFALMELKVLLFNLLLNFKIVKGKKTADPIRLAPTHFNIKAVGGTFIKLEARN